MTSACLPLDYFLPKSKVIVMFEQWNISSMCFNNLASFKLVKSLMKILQQAKCGMATSNKLSENLNIWNLWYIFHHSVCRVPLKLGIGNEDNLKYNVCGL